MGIPRVVYLGVCLLACLAFAPRLFGNTAAAEDAKAPGRSEPAPEQQNAANCRPCHKAWYATWDSSPHGLSLRPVDRDFAATELSLPKNAFSDGKFSYTLRTEENTLLLLENGPEGEKRYKALLALGGQNVWYFLTQLDRGRLHLLPLAYDKKHGQWYDTAQSGVMHIPNRPPGSAFDWKNRGFTFSTACSSCHHNSYAFDYDISRDKYKALVRPSGLACASCHGPGGAHARAQRDKGAKNTPEKSAIIRGGSAFTPQQTNQACAVCHALQVPLTTGFRPGDDYYDHFDLLTLDSPAYFPDGRSREETFTFGSWQLAPCALAGKLTCLHCHTPGGAFRFTKIPNQACAPCHAELVAHPTPHTHHPADSPAGQCISCHMPQNTYARLSGREHSMLPPAPALSEAVGSPNACNACHKDKNAAWADARVRQWHTDDYQAPLLSRAKLINAARKRDWTRMDAMLDYLDAPGRNAFFAASLLRLLAGQNSKELWAADRKALQDSSPLVRAAAVDNLGRSACPDAFPLLLRAVGDEKRLVRIHAAGALSQLPVKGFPVLIQAQLKNAMTEYVSFILARPDLWIAHYRLGNFLTLQGNKSVAKTAYQRALYFEPQALPALINLSVLQNQSGDFDKAEATIRKALKLAPDDAQARLNLGVILGKKGDAQGSEKELRRTLELAPNHAEAAYNLGVLLARQKGEKHRAQALAYTQKAYELRPDKAKYAFAYAYYLHEAGEQDKGIAILQTSLKAQPKSADMYLLLGQMQSDKGDTAGARATYEKALQMQGASDKFKQLLSKKLRELPEPDARASSPTNKAQ